jgi:hypothetical protein
MTKAGYIFGLVLVALLGGTALAQTTTDALQEKLAQAFSGNTVTVNVDMPATNKGIRIEAHRAGSIDGEKNRKRLEAYGTAIKAGDAVKVTGITVRGSEISFELAGGGAPDLDLGALIGPKPEGTTANLLEARARMQVNSASGNKTDTSNNNSALRYLSATRQRADAERMANYETRRREAIEKYRQNALRHGSRFVVELDDDAMEAFTPEALIRVLQNYVVF